MTPTVQDVILQGVFTRTCLFDALYRVNAFYTHNFGTNIYRVVRAQRICKHHLNFLKTLSIITRKISARNFP